MATPCFRACTQTKLYKRAHPVAVICCRPDEYGEATCPDLTYWFKTNRKCFFFWRGGIFTCVHAHSSTYSYFFLEDLCFISIVDYLYFYYLSYFNNLSSTFKSLIRTNKELRSLEESTSCCVTDTDEYQKCFLFPVLQPSGSSPRLSSPSFSMTLHEPWSEFLSCSNIPHVVHQSATR